VNALAPLLLTELLVTPLAAASGRVINVTGGMLVGRLDLQNLQAERGYDKWHQPPWHRSPGTNMISSM
jgi:hypothetical protein